MGHFDIDRGLIRFKLPHQNMAKRHTIEEGNWELIFGRVLELVMANSGEDPFAEVFKILVAKLYSEATDRHQLYRDCIRSDDPVAQFSALLQKVNAHWRNILGEDLEPKLDGEHLRVCLQPLADYSLLDGTFEALDGALEYVVSKSSKSIKGQYFTPRHVVHFCVEALNPQPGELVADPACGSGGFLVHALQHMREQVTEGAKVNAAKSIWGFDYDERSTRLARALMIMAGDGHTNIFTANSLRRPQANRFDFVKDSHLGIEDCLRGRLKNFKGFDVILTNPPFAGEIRETSILSEYELAKGKKSIERDVLFIERCVELLKPGGRMAIVLPNNKLAGTKFSGLRHWILKRARIDYVVSLGRNTFLPHTHQKSEILFCTKRDVGRDLSRDEAILFAVSEREGKDSKGRVVRKEDAPKNAATWDTADHDLGEILSEIKKFRMSNKTTSVK
jgi:type I restriction enzyme M protein